MRVIFFILFMLATLIGCDRSTEVPNAKPSFETLVMWPDLANIPAVSGRSATQTDVAEGRAIFVLQRDGSPIGKPMSLQIPQYAYHIDQDTGERTAGILIQAEEANGQQIAGFFVLSDSSLLAATLPEFELLGTKIPE